eukprot:CAMPEP_0197013698 /NCGR_PEP_ID=MMETSP1380-20130617/67355_1 /TAXON_ID=5936 /ORGANISM="Euplotes crassus, Strain CT5" /LENGTH=109 /DNA_ID=CAMNT_0042438141 /DNA_START=20 /DNA_END=349 /DNA_ORIENTATION=-
MMYYYTTSKSDLTSFLTAFTTKCNFLNLKLAYANCPLRSDSLVDMHKFEFKGLLEKTSKVLFSFTGYEFSQMRRYVSPLALFLQILCQVDEKAQKSYCLNLEGGIPQKE